jgi:excinuclease ABC subunit C
VYIFRSARGDVLYVGKAKSLRPRVRQYFQAGRGDTRLGIDQLVDRIADVEAIVTSSEVEALHLEQNSSSGTARRSTSASATTSRSRTSR